MQIRPYVARVNAFKYSSRINIKHIAITGFAKVPLIAMIEPGLTSVDQHSAEIGKSAAILFFEQTFLKNVTFIPRMIILNLELVTRKSVQFKSYLFELNLFVCNRSVLAILVAEVHPLV